MDEYLAIYLTPTYLPKKNENLCSYKNLYTNEHYLQMNILHNCPKAETTQLSSSDWWINKLCCIYTMDYYSAVKRNELLI